MAPPDLNSLPPSRSMSSSPMAPRAMQTVTSPPNRQDTPSPRASISLASAATLNAANESRRSSISNRGSPRLGRMPSDRRRSQVAMNLNLNDPTVPSPGELSSSDPRANMADRISHFFSAASPPTIGGRPAVATGDPHHQRQPSLGDVHNALEQEQEMQVNRMLQLIREQQMQNDALRNQQEQSSRRSSQQNSTTPGNTAVIDDLTPASERSISFPSIHPAVPAVPHSRRISLSHNRSSASRSPNLRTAYPVGDQTSNFDYPSSPIDTQGRRNSFRNESAFYQAETANLTRENQMLRMRIRELEKQIGELSTAPANTPIHPSNLVTSPPVEAEDEASAAAEIARITGEADKA
ncbi:hypothetical protein B0A52_00354 [Exophiala mesophila]|uniref:Uncharacterized protein n=1 Tax=Exophiala mesophila TaxID=212818 RepID=A0A438NJS7_EXOME|nr:hypothetical protein B0A52_00354 [Exophiala mesophila]